ncbi:MAG TPA: D-alanine--D-alanine ligase, partial [Spirochaetes bacterium]|nr:D-alanine--D-alanine ligase [Spirochaetota bacterium]
MSQMKVGLIFGGKSGEHDVSILSASSVLRAIDKSRYLPVPIGIKKDGSLASFSDNQSMLAKDLSHLVDKDFPYNDFSLGLSNNTKLLDVIFPVLHGPNGEDGTIQGCLELMDIPFVGSGVLGSSTGMDKDIMKRVFESHGLPQLPFYSFKSLLWEQDSSKVMDAIESLIPYPHFIKPANMGSSVGVHKAHNRKDLAEGIRDALKYDHKIVVEKGIDVREIEVAILGNEEPKVSVPGEILPSKEFYDYEAKYLSNDSE